MAVAIPVPMVDKVTTIGSAFGAGLVEAASYRANPTLGTIVTFGGGMLGLLGAMTLGPRLAQVAEGIASSSAGSLGHFAIKTVWPARRGLGGGNGRRPIGGNPKEIVGKRGTPGNPGNPGNPANRRRETANDELRV